MILPQLHPASPGCKLCDLGGGCRTPGIPTRAFAEVDPSRPALLLVGQNPGHAEDESGQCFVGPSGQMVARIYLEASGLGDPSSRTVYLSNTARCATPKGDPTNTHYRTCSSAYLLQDMAAIRALHPSLHVLCLGAPATRHVHARLGGPNLSLTDAFARGPVTYDHLPCGPITVSSTFHPAYLMRDANKIHAVARHLSQLLDFLTQNAPAPPPLRIVAPGAPPRRQPCANGCEWVSPITHEPS